MIIDNTEFSYYKLNKTGNKSDYTFVSNYSGMMTSLSDNESILNGFQFGKAFKMTLNLDFSAINFANEDKLVIGGENYYINSIVKRNNVGVNTLKLILTKE